MTKKKATPARKKKKSDRREAVHPIHRDKDVPRRSIKQTRKPDFEKALDEVPAKDQAAEVREGPGGQDPGAPDDLDRLDRELSKAPKALAPVLKIPFSIWASISQIPEMKLSDPEAQELAEPIIALLEYYFPGRIPEIIWSWLMLLTATEKVIDSRVKIRYEKRKALSVHGGRPAPREPAAHTTQPAPDHNGAEPAQGYPKE